MLKRLSRLAIDFKPAVCLLALPIALTGCGDAGEDARADAPSESVGGTSATATADGRASLKPEPKAPDNPRAAENVEVKDGFQVELLYKTDKPNQGSWVALTSGPGGTLYATDQYNVKGQALYHLKPPAIGDADGELEVIPQPVQLNGAQGLCYAFDALYVMETGKGNGLMRVTDSDGDGLLDKKEQILDIYGGGEHGTHAIVPTPDGKALYIIAGNMSPLPKPEHSRPVYKLWDEDQLLKREPDARGHASSVMAPGGWICRIDPDGKNLTLISHGYRNAYDLAVDLNGELFTYDSDMEWDIGQPWYRPTRVNHAVSGSEFGWRNGSGKWPEYFEDSLSSVVDIGPGSPVGVLFGYGAKFPTAYQDALYILDWTYGTIYAVHMQPDGASYTGEIEPFVYGKPLPLTDAVVGDDGAMYFATGGRRGDSALYRVVYYGVNDQAAPKAKPLTELAKLRRKLEELHKPGAGADQLDFIWKNLGHSDRHIRFAARVALEHLSPNAYIGLTKAETDPMTRVAAGLALARHKNAAATGVLLDTDLSKADDTVKLAWLRALGVDYARRGQPVEGYRTGTLNKLAALLPSENPAVNVEIVRMRVFLEDPTVIDFALDLMNNMKATETPAWMDLAAKNDRYGKAIIAMRDNPPPVDQFNIAFMLRNIKEGWTPQTRQTYFAWLRRAARGNGGNSYKGYIQKVKNQAIETLTEEEKVYLGALLEPQQDIANLPPLVEPRGPGRPWNTAVADKLVTQRLKKGTRSYDRGVGLYQATLCSECHRVDTLGGEIGPDLTSVVNKFTVKDLLLHTIEPSHEISEQYALATVVKKDGTKVIGRVLEKTDSAVKVQPDVRKEDTVSVPMDQVASIDEAKASAMPQGLVNALSADELADLVAFIMSKGNPNDELFKK